MFYINDYETLCLIIILYLVIYNFSLFFLFWLLLQYVSFKTLTLYSFNDFYLNSFYLFLLTILLFSLAGIPPLLGFFTKLFILLILLKTEFFFFFIFFFSLLFFSLYFYLQNIRFLYTTTFRTFIFSFSHTLAMRFTS